MNRLRDMDLLTQRELLSIVQVALAVIALWLGEGGSWWAIFGAIALTVVAYLRPLPKETSLGVQRMWTILVFFALIASITRAVLSLEIIDAGIDFLLLLCVQRFFNRQKTREHLQLQMLAAVLMVLASVINTELSFPIILLAYLPLAIMGLVVNLLLGEGERLGARVQYELGRTSPERKRLLWVSSFQVALAAVAAGAVVFVAFPRVGTGFFFRNALAQNVQSGFSEQVRLGGFGRIKSDPTVVMRIEVADGTPTTDRVTWHLRGSAFDRYEDGLWSHSGEGERVRADHRLRFRVIKDQRGPLATVPSLSRVERQLPQLDAVPVAGFAASTQTIRASVTLEDIGTDLVFAISEPLAAGLPGRENLDMKYEWSDEPNIDVTEDRQFAILHKRAGPVRYTFVSRTGEPTPAELRAVGEPPVPATLEPYLQVSDGLSEEVDQLAREITAGATTRYDKALAVMTWLGELDYTLDQPASQRVAQGADPVEGFLFETKAGHCEYFATAMAILLREVGVPARNVNGYYGAEWNPLGEFYAVRQSNAHSWVEVYFDGIGWVTFDPTPPAGRQAGDNAAIFPRITQIFDAVRNAYLGYVIDYDLGKQISMLENLGVANRPKSGIPEIDWLGIAWWSAVPIGVLALGLAIRALRRRRSVRPDVAIYERVLAHLARHGHAREESESPLRYARRLRAANVSGGEALERFARMYEATRFAASPPPDGLTKLREAADAVITRTRDR